MNESDADFNNLRPFPGDADPDATGNVALLRARFLAYLEQTFPSRDYRRGVWLAASLMGLGAGYIAGTGVTIALAPDHASKAALLLPLVALLVARAGVALQRLRKTRRYYNRLRRVADTGTRVNAYVVQANEALFQPGDTSLPCLVLFSFQPEVGGDTAYMRSLARRVFRLKNTQGQTDDARAVARLVTDERAVPYRRRALPFSFTDGSTIYCADLWVKPSYLPQPYLTGAVLPCLAEPGLEGGLELIPSWLLAFPDGGDTPPAAPSSRSRVEG